MRLVKRGTNNQSRDDVAAALTLAAGAYERARGKWVAETVAYHSDGESVNERRLTDANSWTADNH